MEPLRSTHTPAQEKTSTQTSKYALSCIASRIAPIWQAYTNGPKAAARRRTGACRSPWHQHDSPRRTALRARAQGCTSAPISTPPTPRVCLRYCYSSSCRSLPPQHQQAMVGKRAVTHLFQLRATPALSRYIVWRACAPRRRLPGNQRQRSTAQACSGNTTLPSRIVSS